MMKKILFTTSLCCGLLCACSSSWADTKLYQTPGETIFFANGEFGIVASNGVRSEANSRWTSGLNVGVSGKYVYDISKHWYHYGTSYQREEMGADYFTYRVTLGAKQYSKVLDQTVDDSYKLANLGLYAGLGWEFTDESPWSGGVALYLGTRIGSDGHIPFAYQVIPYVKYKDVTIEFLTFNFEVGHDKNKEAYFGYDMGIGAGIKF